MADVWMHGKNGTTMHPSEAVKKAGTTRAHRSTVSHRQRKAAESDSTTSSWSSPATSRGKRASNRVTSPSAENAWTSMGA